MLDHLTRVVEERGFDVITAATGFQAHGHLETGRAIAVVLAQWDNDSPLGGEVYRWVLRNRYALRGQFVFLAIEAPDGFDALVAGRCLIVDPYKDDELVNILEAAARRIENLATREPDGAWIDGERPTLLLVDDDPTLLLVIAELLGDAGFSVMSVEGGDAATAQLERSSFDVVVSDWQMDGGSGADLYRWIVVHRPDLAERFVFLSDGRVEQIRARLPNVPVFVKGQDADGLIAMLRETAAQSRAARRGTGGAA
jgi:DNA-binding response OmpR family regulator